MTEVSIKESKDCKSSKIIRKIPITLCCKQLTYINNYYIELTNAIAAFNWLILQTNFACFTFKLFEVFIIVRLCHVVSFRVFHLVFIMLQLSI